MNFVIVEPEGKATNLHTQVTERLYICIYSLHELLYNNAFCSLFWATFSAHVATLQSVQISQ